MKILITLATINGRGAIAGIESPTDIFSGDMDVAGSETSTPKEACLAAAKSLRDAAERFDKLALAADPFSAFDQAVINDGAVAV